DVNKQVLFATRPDGTIVGRKLIGATADGRLAGYKSYASEHAGAMREAFTATCARFADACGLRLDDDAIPEELHDGFWYDDGNEPWRDDDVPWPDVAHHPGDPDTNEARSERTWLM